MLSKMFDSLLEGRKEEFMKMLPAVFHDKVFVHNAAATTLEKYFMDQLNWALVTLKKNDRITWYMRLVKVHCLVQLINGASPSRDQEEIAKMQQELKKSIDKLGGTVANIQINRVKSMLTHFMSLDNPKIQSIVFDKQMPSELFDQMADLEHQYVAQQKRSIKHTEPQGTVIEKFNNNWVWVDLGTSTCSVEGRAMGHCGNAGNPKQSETILSLREPTKDGWIPHATFIFDKQTGLIGEMKGYGNQKPGKEYHQYILKLLENPMIKGIQGGGYLPGNNFSITDLTPAEQEELIKKFPQYANLSTKLQKFGITRQLLSEINHKVTRVNDFDTPEFVEKLPGFVIYELTASVDGDYPGTLDHYMKYLNGDEIMDFTVDHQEIVDFFDHLPKETQNQIRNYLEDKYSVQIQDEDIDITDDAAIVNLLQEHNEELYETLRSSVYAGREAGTHREIYEAIQTYLDDPSDNGMSNIHTRMTGVGDMKDWGTQFWLKPEALCTMIDTDELEEYQSWEDYVHTQAPLLHFEAPHYGFDGYDQKAAIEYFFESQSQFEAPKPKEK